MKAAVKPEKGSVFFGNKITGKDMHCPHCDKQHMLRGEYLAAYDETNFSRPVIKAMCLRCGGVSFPKMIDRIRRTVARRHKWIFDGDAWKKEKKAE